jgi:hypothetical protein
MDTETEKFIAAAARLAKGGEYDVTTVDGQVYVMAAGLICTPQHISYDLCMVIMKLAGWTNIQRHSAVAPGGRITEWTFGIMRNSGRPAAFCNNPRMVISEYRPLFTTYEFTTAASSIPITYIAPLPRILGISGFAGSGKDTLAAILVARGWRQVAFAGRLRRMAAMANPLCNGRPYNDLVAEFGYEGAKKQPGVRDQLVRLGEAARCLLSSTYWIDAAIGVRSNRPPLPYPGENEFANIWHVPVSAIHDDFGIEYTDTPIVVSDVRYANEAAAIERLGGVVIRLTRPGIGPANGTEAASLSAFTPAITIANDGTVEDLSVALTSIPYTK